MRPAPIIFSLLVLGGSVAEAARISAWIVSRDPSALQSLHQYSRLIDEANPVWYTLGVEGKILKKTGAESSEWRAAMAGMELIPTVQNTDMGKFAVMETQALLANPMGRDAHVDELVRLAVVNAYDGLEIDYEWLMASGRDDFTIFLRDLASELHREGKILSVTLHPKTRETDRDGPGSQDWREIGQIADRVKIMIYDYHWATSEPGPIAPPEWIANVIAYARSTLPAHKTMIALPWYGYDWEGMKGDPVFYKDAVARLQMKKAQLMRDPSGEATFMYEGRKVYFQDAESYRRKVEQVRALWPEMAGFAHWRPGGEDPGKWSVISNLRAEGARRRPVRRFIRQALFGTGVDTPLNASTGWATAGLLLVIAGAGVLFMSRR